MKTPEDICPDFPEWPERWHGVRRDIPYGQALLAIMRPFAAHLIATGLTKRTIRRHMDNLWLLGGEVIRRVSENDWHDVPPLAALLECIDSSGGPYCRHIDSEYALDSFDATCRKFYRFLKSDDDRGRSERRTSNVRRK